MNQQHSTTELLRKTIEFYYPPIVQNDKHFLIRELVIRKSLAQLQAQIEFIEDDFQKLIAMPPDYEGLIEGTPVIHHKLFNRLHSYFMQYIDCFSRRFISYPASRNLKDLMLFFYISKYADNIQANLVKHYYENYYSNTRYRSTTSEQVMMSKTLSNILIGDIKNDTE